MKRQIVGIVLAVVLAVIGTVALVSYVRSAKDDAVAEEALVGVYVVSDDIGKGVPLGAFRNDLRVDQVPRRLVAPDAVQDITILDEALVSAVELKVGEQLLTSRLVDARSLVRVDVPEGLQEITVALSPERAVGGAVAAGATVGVLFSFQPFDVEASAETVVDPAAPTTSVATRKTPNTTHLTLHKVLVTAVQFSEQDRSRASEIQSDGATETTVDAAIAESPADQLLVTLAVSAAEAEQLVFAAEFGTIWLTSEGPDSTEEGTRILTLEGVYVTVPR